MLQLGVGFAPRSMRQPLPRSAHEILLFVGTDGSDVSASVTGELTIEVAAPSPHAGRHRIDLAALVQGPVCLVPPALRDPDGGGTRLAVEPGLWVADATLGEMGIGGQWLVDGSLLPDADGGTLILTEAHAGRDIVYIETARQRGRETLGRSAAVRVPENSVEPLRSTPEVTLQATLVGKEPATVTIKEPPEYAGVHTLDPAALSSGPVCLVVPTVGGDPAIGAVLTAVPGLWIHDADAGVLTVSGQWHDGEVPMPGATGLTYTRQAGDHPVYVETATDANGSRTASADAGATMAVGAAPDTFTAPDGTLLSAYVGESGIGWGASPNRGVIEAGALRNLTALGWYLQPRLGDLPADQFAEADLVVGTSDQMASLALRISDDMTAGYMILVRASGIQVARRASSGQTAIIANIPGNRMAGISIRVRFEAEGSALRLYLDGDLLWSGADATFAAGRAGIVANGTVASRKGSYITSFHAGELE